MSVKKRKGVFLPVFLWVVSSKCVMNEEFNLKELDGFGL